MTTNLDSCIREMTEATTALDAIPDTHVFTQGQLATIDDVRQAALALATMAESVIHDFQGK